MNIKNKVRKQLEADPSAWTPTMTQAEFNEEARKNAGMTAEQWQQTGYDKRWNARAEFLAKQYKQGDVGNTGYASGAGMRAAFKLAFGEKFEK